jgi:PAS domain S-box-containing protein
VVIPNQALADGNNAVTNLQLSEDLPPFVASTDADIQADYAVIVRESRTGYIRLDPYGRVTFANAATLSMLGMPLIDIMAQRLGSITRPNELSRFLDAQIMQVLGSDEHRAGRFQQTLIEGPKFIDIRVSPIYRQGKCTSIFVRLVDVSHTQLQLQERQKTAVLLEQAVSSAELCMAVYSMGGDTRYWNHRMAEVTGVSSETAIGKQAAAYFPREFAEAITTPFIQIVGDPDGRKLSQVMRTPFAKAPLVRCDWRMLLTAAGKRIGVLVMVENITDSQLMSTELEGIRAALERSQEMYFRVASTGRVLDANAAACRKLGYERDDLLKLSVPNIDLMYRTQEAFQNRWHELVAAKYGVGETAYRCADGSKMATELSVHYLEKDDEAIVLARDISKRKKLEIEAIASAEQFRAYFVDSPMGILIRDADLNILQVNNAMLNLTGYTHAEMTGMPLRQLIHPDDLPVAQGVWDHFVNQTSKTRNEGRLITKTGESIWVAASVSLMNDKANSAQYIVVVENINERKQFQEKLESALLAQAAILETTSAGVVQIRHGVIELCNRAFEKLFGYERGQLFGRNLAELVGGDAQYQSLRQNARDSFARGEPFTIEVPLLARNGSRIWGNVQALPITKSDPESAVILTFHDVTDSREHQQRLVKALNELEAMFQTTFVGISHVRDGLITRANSQLEHIFGYGSGEMVGLNMRDLLRDETGWRSIETAMNQALMDTGMYSAEATFRKLDGSTVHCLINAGVVDRRDPSLPRIAAYIDITDRVNGEKALAASNRRIYALLDSVPDAIWFKDAEGLIEAVNQQFISSNRSVLASSIKTPADAVGKTMNEIFDGHALSSRQTDLVVMNAKAIHKFEASGDVDGELIWHEITKAPMLNAEGDCVGIVGVSRDVTENRRRRDEMARLLREQNVLFDMTSVGICYVENRIVARCNRRLEGIVGYDIGALIGTKDSMLFPGREDVDRAFMLIKHSNGPLPPFEQQLRRKNGSLVWCSIQVNPINPSSPTDGYIVTVSDITDIKDRENALRTVLNEQQVILDNAVVGVGFLRGGVFVRVNETLALTFGREPEGLLHESLALFFPNGGEWDAFREAMTANLVITGSYLCERKMVRKDGAEIWCYVHLRSVNAERPLDDIIITLLDITLRMEADEKLSRTRTFLDLVVDNMPVVVAVRDAKNKQYMRFNRVAELLTGLKRDDVLGKTPEEIYPEDVFEEIDAIDQKVIRLKTIVEEQTDITNRVLGLKRIINRRSVPVLGSDGDVSYVMSVAEDITERVRSEAALRESEQRFRQFAENIRQVIFLTNVTRTRWDYFNQRGEDVWGMTPTEVSSTPTAAMRVVVEEDVPLFAEGLRQEAKLQATDIEARIDHPSKGRRWVRLQTFPMATESDEIRVFGLIDDITEQKDAEQARIDHLIEQRDVLVREVHHRIKNNLQGVAGLLQHAAKARPELKPHLNEVSTQIQAIAQVHGLQVRAGQALKLRTLAKAIFDNLARISPKPVFFQALESFDRFALPEQEAVPLALVLNELGTNGVKHGGDGVHISMHALSDTSLEFRVQNKGILPKDFDFKRVGSHASGIGLIKALVPRRGGLIEFKQVGENVIVTVRLEPPALIVEQNAGTVTDRSTSPRDHNATR